MKLMDVLIMAWVYVLSFSAAIGLLMLAADRMPRLWEWMTFAVAIYLFFRLTGAAAPSPLVTLGPEKRCVRETTVREQ